MSAIFKFLLMYVFVVDMNPIIQKLLDNINSLGKELDHEKKKENEAKLSDDVHQEALRCFNRGGESSHPTSANSTLGQSASQPNRYTGTASTCTSTGVSRSIASAPKFQLAYNFMRSSKRQKRKTTTKQATGSFIKDVILLGGPEDDKVPRQGVRVFLSENNHIVSGASFNKEWDFLTLCDYLKSLFPSQLGEFDDITILLPIHSKLLPPNLPPGQQLSAFIVQKIFKDRPLYIRPHKCILNLEGIQSSSKKKKVEYEVYDLSDEEDIEDIALEKSVFAKQENTNITGNSAVVNQTDSISSESSTMQAAKPDIPETKAPEPSIITSPEKTGREASSEVEIPLPTTCSSGMSDSKPPESSESVKMEAATPPTTSNSTGSSELEAATPPTTSNSTGSSELEAAIKCCLEYCFDRGISDPVEVLRCAQSAVNIGRDLDIQSVSESLKGVTNFINIDRYNVLGSAMEEIQEIKNPRLTLEVSFYGESAEDSGGPRREFFRLCLKEIKAKYFDNGLKEHLSKDYENVGLLMALSVLQNGSIPRFLSENHLQELFNSSQPSKCIRNLRKGFAMVGLYQIGRDIPTFLYLFYPSPAAMLSRRMLLQLLSPKFSEDGSNARKEESSVYGAFNKYCREAAAGRRRDVSLSHVLQFVTGAEEEPPLGFGVHPAIEFPEATGGKPWNFVPFANTCANTLHLPRPTVEHKLPKEESLYEIFDLAFVNTYFGKV